MNDFTKDELIDLNIVLCVWVNKYPGDTITRNLQSKIESMIGNYCEHENLKDVGKSYKVCRSCAEEVYE